jgi:UDP-glucose:(heptosyl)LPS alpha-1,3-glucosyltransferase
MKIGLVRRGHSATGGAEAYLLRFAAEARRFGHEMVLITTADWPADRWTLGSIIRLGGGTPAEFATAFGLAGTGCDVHLSFERVPGCEVFRAGDGVHAAWLERRAAFEPFWKRATRWMNRKHGELMRLEREVFDPARTRFVIANSMMVRDEILGRFSFPADRIRVVYNGLTPLAGEPDRHSSREAFGIGQNQFCVLFAGSGWERKGLRTAIEAVEMCHDTTLLVAGRGPADLYRSDVAKFVGPVPDLRQLFAAADIFILPTWYDPFSNACLEALAAGLPVMTTKANGFAEIIMPGVHGSVVEPGDAPGFAEAIDGWRARVEPVREACRNRAAEFSIERNVRETLAILESGTQR